MGYAEDLVNNLHIQTEEEEFIEKQRLELKENLAYDKKLETFLSDSNIPKRYFEGVLSDLNDEDYTFIKEKKFSILKGDLGVGKTYTACASSINAFKLFKIESYFMRCYQLKTMDINDLKALIKKCQGVKVLIVDDLGMVSGNQFVTELIAAMLLSRIDDDLRTIITVNENLKATKTEIGIFDDRIADKLMESFVAKIMTGKNKRKRAK